MNKGAFMPEDRKHQSDNHAQRLRLHALVARLSDHDLLRPMPAGWTIAAILAHMAFWDARAVVWLDKWASGVEPTKPDYETSEDVDWINDSAKPLCLALAPRDAANLAIRLADEADRKVATLSDDMLAKVRALGVPFGLSRAEHRNEHLDDIERLLKLI